MAREEYKSAVEQLTHEKFSGPSRFAMDRLLGSMTDSITQVHNHAAVPGQGVIRIPVLAFMSACWHAACLLASGACNLPYRHAVAAGFVW